MVRKNKGAHLDSHLSGIYSLEGKQETHTCTHTHTCTDTHADTHTHTPFHVESQLQVAAAYHRCTQTHPQKRPDLTRDFTHPDTHTHTHSDLHVGSAKNSPSNTSHAHMLAYTHTRTDNPRLTQKTPPTQIHIDSHTHSIFHVRR